MGHKKCAVNGCLSRTKRMFAFPNPQKDRERFCKWLSASGNPTLLDVPPNKIIKRTICEEHFEEKYKFPKKLLCSAIPTLFLPEPIYFDEDDLAINMANNSIQDIREENAIPSTSKNINAVEEEYIMYHDCNEIREPIHVKAVEEELIDIAAERSMNEESIDADSSKNIHEKGEIWSNNINDNIREKGILASYPKENVTEGSCIIEEVMKENNTSTSIKMERKEKEKGIVNLFERFFY